MAKYGIKRVCPRSVQMNSIVVRICVYSLAVMLRNGGVTGFPHIFSNDFPKLFQDFSRIFNLISRPIYNNHRRNDESLIPMFIFTPSTLGRNHSAPSVKHYLLHILCMFWKLFFTKSIAKHNA